MHKKDKLKLALDLIHKNKTTAYQISKSKKISAFAIQKIITGSTIRPNERTLDLIIDYHNEKLKVENIKTDLENIKLLEDLCSQLKKIDYLKGLLRKNNIDFNE
jgi:hypothetical protein